MFKLVTTLVRGAAAAAEEQLTDRHALLILDQHIRDAAAGVDRASARWPSPSPRTTPRPGVSKGR